LFQDLHGMLVRVAAQHNAVHLRTML
jgi:hypothetical protein